MQFCHLHVHSCFTFGEGVSTPDELIEVAKKLDMKTLALTDKDGLYGAVRFYKKAKKEGIKPIIGAEIATEKGYPLVLLAKGKKGYSNLSQLITKSHLSSPNGPCVSFDMLSQFSQDLFALSGGPKGEISFYLKIGKKDLAEKLAKRYIKIFGRENFIIELQDHLLPEEYKLNSKLFDLACKLHLLVVATNNVYYAKPVQHELHQILVRASKIVHHRSIVERPNSEYYLKSYPKMASVSTRYPFALFNTDLVARECNLDLPLGKIQTPLSLNKANEHFYLAKICFQNLPKLYHPPSKKVTQRLIRELKIIKEKGFSSYFLLVQDIVKFARKKGIRCSARGSASGSVVAYLTGISQIDPIENDLLFERFLNPERVDFPDIDLDFDSRRRDEVIDYVFKKYGKDKVALVATIPTFRARGAIREAARAVGLEYDEIDKLLQFLPYLPADKIADALNSLPELKESRLKDFEELVDISCEMNGLARNLSSHLGGVVISDNNLSMLVPLQKSAKGYPLCQFDKDDLESLGLIKLDLLSLRMLGAIEEALENIRRKGIHLNLDKIPFNDEKVYELLREAKTVGCFQLESPGMRQLLGRLQPKNFKDIVANISLFRPGPMQADMVTPFLERRWGREKISYPHPCLEPILKDTYGVIIFHEQVLRIAKELAGFSLGEADLLRRSMKEKLTDEEKERLKSSFLKGCKKKGVDKKIAEKVFEKISSFGAFGFCKAHATAFARIAYQSAYLKVYFPKEFFLGILNNEPGLYPSGVILNEAKRYGISILGPDINKSREKFVIENNAIRVGLLFIEKMGPKQVRKILRERGEREFSSFKDFCRRVRIDKNLLENLVLVGCFDSLGEKREKLLHQFPHQLIRSGRDAANCQPLSLYEKIALEMSILGFSFSGHPLMFFRRILEQNERVKSSELANFCENEKVRVAGIKVILHTPPTKSGKRVIFLTLEDEEGLIDTVIFPSVQQEFAKTIYEANFLFVEGYIKKHGSATSIVVEKAYDLQNTV